MIDRYKTDEIQEVFEEQKKFDIFLNIELLALEARYLNQLITKNEYESLKKKACFKLKRIHEIEQITHHDVVAFIEAVSENLGDEKKWFHYGLTSSDIVDTANAYQIKLANDVLEQSIQTFIDVLKKKALIYKDTPCIARTHGVHAEVSSFGLKFAVFYDEMKRNLERFQRAREEIEVGKISGAVGNYTNIPPFVEEHVCKSLGLHSADISTQIVSRDRYAYYFSILTLISSILEKIATEIRQLQRTEVNEVQEFFEDSQKSSSAMPHKKNPISSENICGCARLMRGYMFSAYENINLWHERDLSNSSVERIIIEDSCQLLHYMLKRYTNTIEKLVINVEQMKKNIDITKGAVFSENIMNQLIRKGFNRQEAYDLVKSLVLESIETQKHLKEICLNKLESIFSQEEINQFMDINTSLQHVDTIYHKLGLLQD